MRLPVTCLSSLLLASVLVTAAGAAPRAILVKWKTAVRSAERAALRDAVGAPPGRSYAAISVERLEPAGLTPEEAVLRLRQDPRILYAEPDVEVHAARTPDDPLLHQQWGLHNTGQTGGVAGADIRALRGWNRVAEAPDVLIGVLDSGADLAHPDLASNLWVNPGEIRGNGIDDDGNGYVDDVHGYDFRNRDPDPTDDYGHGTHVAGVIAASGNNGRGVAGVAWRARLMVLKFLGPTGSGEASAAVEAILYANRMGARVVNHSWGGTVRVQALEDALAASGRAGVLSIAAAGNAAADVDLDPFYPAASPEPTVISVAATTSADSLARFSNRGRTGVDLAAPGAEIVSTWPGGRYLALSGTSQAAPMVSGAAALLIALHGERDPLVLRQRLLEGVVARPALEGACATGGRLDLVRLLAEPESVPPARVSDLRALRIGSRTLRLGWTAVGDDGMSGTSDAYEVFVADAPFDGSSLDRARRVSGPEPLSAGAGLEWRVDGLDTERTYWAAVRALDDRGNVGELSEPVAFTTLPPPRAVLAGSRLEVGPLAGATEARAVELHNDSPGTLRWSLARSRFDAREDQPPVRAGLRVQRSDEPGGPRFAWLGATADDVELPLSGDEAISDAVPIGFTFPWMDREYGSLRVSTNGFITFVEARSAPVTSPLPSRTAPAPLLAPFWDDLDGGEDARIRVRREDGLCVVTWEATRRFGSARDTLTFQVVLQRSGEVRFQYGRLRGRTDRATIGVQDITGTLGVGLAHRQPFARESLAVRFAPPRTWLSVSPADGELGPGERASLRFEFDARRQPGGRREAVVEILTDDPDRARLPLTAVMHGIAAPELIVPATLAFRPTRLGERRARSLVLENAGEAELEVHLTPADGVFSLEGPHSRVLSPGEADAVPVLFEPEHAREYVGSLGVMTGGGVQTVVRCRGEGMRSGRLRARAHQLRAEVAPGLAAAAGSATRTVHLINDGGAPVEWTLALESENAPRREGGAPDGGQAAPPEGNLLWSLSDEPGAPAFAWAELGPAAVRLFGAADDSTHTGLRLAFPFPFLGRSWSGVHVCTNGWLSFLQSVPTPVDRALPDPAAPPALIAPWWTDLDLRLEPGSGVFASGDSTRMVIEWRRVRAFGGAGPYTFQVWLRPDGRIDFLYRRMAGDLGRATVGIQDSEGRRGWTLAHRQAYVRDSLRISFRPTPQWLSAARTRGRLAPGGSDSVQVHVNAAALSPGAWRAEMAFTDGGSAVEPVELEVQVGAIERHVAADPAQLISAARQPRVRLELAQAGPAAWSDVYWSDAAFEPGAIGREPGALSVRSLDWLDAADAVPSPSPWLALREPGVGWWRLVGLPQVVPAAREVAGVPLGGPPPAAGDSLRLSWSGVHDFEVYATRDRGTRWQLLASGRAQEAWVRLPEEAEALRLEVVWLEGGEVRAATRTPPFAVAPALVPSRLALEAMGAHPSPGPASLRLALPVSGPVRLDVHDIRGARWSVLWDGSLASGLHTFVWDGRGRGGALAPAGVYLVRAVTPAGTVTRRWVRL